MTSIFSDLKNLAFVLKLYCILIKCLINVFYTMSHLFSKNFNTCFKKSIKYAFSFCRHIIKYLEICITHKDKQYNCLHKLPATFALKGNFKKENHVLIQCGDKYKMHFNKINLLDP